MRFNSYRTFKENTLNFRKNFIIEKDLFFLIMPPSTLLDNMAHWVGVGIECHVIVSDNPHGCQGSRECEWKSKVPRLQVK